MTTADAIAFFSEFTHCEPTEFRQLAQSGSSRINWYALAGGKAFIVTFNDNIRENEAFFYFSEVFALRHCHTPAILKIDSSRKLYIQQYLGSHTLSEIIASEGESSRVQSLVKASLEQLYRLQQETAGAIDYKKTFEYEKYDALPVLHDLYYFKNFMVDVLELPYHKSALLKEFNQIVTKIQSLTPKVLMLRDFQSRNIIINENDEVFFIDYQSAMEGPVMYDVVSFLHQAKARFSTEFKDSMEDFFISHYPAGQQEILKYSAKYLQLMRYLQVLGAYGFRGLIQRKSHFLDSIHQGIQNLSAFCTTWPEMHAYPALNALSQELARPQTKNKIDELTNNR